LVLGANGRPGWRSVLLLDFSEIELVRTPQKQRRRGGNAKSRCTTGPERWITRWEHVLEAAQQRLDKNPRRMRARGPRLPAE
jgi:hypothetical protein